MKTLLYLFLVAIGPVYALRSGRASASRMKDLRSDLVENNLRGYLIVAVVVGLVVATHLL